MKKVIFNLFGLATLLFVSAGTADTISMSPGDQLRAKVNGILCTLTVDSVGHLIIQVENPRGNITSTVGSNGPISGQGLASILACPGKGVELKRDDKVEAVVVADAQSWTEANQIQRINVPKPEADAAQATR